MYSILLSIAQTLVLSVPDDRSSKLRRVVQMYRAENSELSLPANPDLEEIYDDIIFRLRQHLRSAKKKDLLRVHTIVCNQYRTYIGGIKTGPLPNVRVDSEDLYKFIAEKSNAYEVLLVQNAIDAPSLTDKKLKDDFCEYKFQLAKFLSETSITCKKRKIPIPYSRECTDIAVMISGEQVLLSLVLHLKEYFKKYLGLDESFFEGFVEGCIIFFFAINEVDAVMLAPRILSHSKELKSKFGISHLAVRNYFLCDLVQGTLHTLVCVSVLQCLLYI